MHFGRFAHLRPDIVLVAHPVFLNMFFRRAKKLSKQEGGLSPCYFTLTEDGSAQNSNATFSATGMMS